MNIGYINVANVTTLRRKLSELRWEDGDDDYSEYKVPKSLFCKGT